MSCSRSGTPPVPHRQSRTSLGRRHHPPPPRDHRDHLRRPDRPTPRAPAFGPVRREHRMDPVCGDQPQPAPRRRHDGRPRPSRRPRRDLRRTIVTCPLGSPNRNAGPCCTCQRTGPGPIPGSGCGTASSVTDYRPRSQPDPTTQPRRPLPKDPPHSGNAGQTSGLNPSAPAHHPHHDQLRSEHSHQADPRIEAKCRRT